MTKLKDILDPEKLHEALSKGLIRMQRHPDFPNLVIFNYTDACAWERAWTHETLSCRGLVVDTDDEPTVLARPYDKFFNYDEVPHDPGKMNGPVEVTDKMDGSLGIGFRYRGAWHVATRGSFASDQATWATKWLRENTSHFTAPMGWTPLWEIIYPSNRIVVNYHGYEGLVLLGWRHIRTGKLAGPLDFGDYWRGDRTEVLTSNSLSEVLETAPRENAEGVVVRWLDSGLQLKVKQEDYKRLHAVVTNTTNRNIWQALSGDLSIDLNGVPDEFKVWVEKTAEDLQDQFLRLHESVVSQYAMIRATLPRDMERKTFAMKAKQHPYAAALFKLLDGKSIDKWVWAQLKPETIERPFQES